MSEKRASMQDKVVRGDVIKYIRENISLGTFMKRTIRAADEACWGLCDKLNFVPAVEERPCWTPCAKRLPTRNDHKDGMVLVCHATGLIRFGAYIDGEWVTGEPIAWMPLPEPYEEEQDEQGAG